jgi:CDP-diglyceride synthetase
MKNLLTKINPKKNWRFIVGALAVVLAGVLTAWLISGRVGGGSSAVAPGAKATSTEAGVLDPKVKYDTAAGILQKGGIENEGTYHLVREGGPSKNVYLTSSVLDLSIFIDKKVEIWGQTLASKKAGWLMDVAKIKVAP